jgi:hypothetical protein
MSELMELNYFIETREMHIVTFQTWINGDEGTLVLEFDDNESGLNCNALIKDVGRDEKPQSYVYGLKFEHIASFVDAVRGIRNGQTTIKGD